MVNSAMNSDRTNTTDDSHTTNSDGPLIQYTYYDPQPPKAVSSEGSVASILPPLPFPTPRQGLRTSTKCRTTTLWPPKPKYKTTARSTFNAEASMRRASTAPVLGKTNYVSTCRPGDVPEMPPVMVFHGWYQEGHGGHWNDRKQFRVEFDTASKECAISVDGSLMVVAATTPKKEPIDIWDLHVGAVIIVLGKRLELRKAQLATQMWLDDQATKMLQEKKILEAELMKFGGVSYNEDYANRTNPQHRPRHLNKTKAYNPYAVGNGRISLRRLGQELSDLSLKMRKYRRTIPGRMSELAPPEFMEVTWPEDSVPDLWNAELMRAAIPESEPSAVSTKSARSNGNLNYYEWLKTIPLARTAAGIESVSPEPWELDNDASRTAYGATRELIKANDEQHRLNMKKMPKVDPNNPFAGILSSFKTK